MFPLGKVIEAIRAKGEYVLTDDVSVKRISPTSPAEKAGVQEGDIIYSVDGNVVRDIDTFLEQVNKTNGKTIELMVSRNHNVEKTLLVTPVFNTIYNRYTIGVEVVNYEFQPTPLIKIIPKTIVLTFRGQYDPHPFIKSGWLSLLGLLYGLLLILISVGILKLKKWAVLLYVLIGLSYVVTFFGMPIWLYRNRLSISADLSSLMPYFLASIMVPSSFYFVSKWKLFR
jgi:membrane-associated protease RseP (regulator of RpoE activity)